MIIHTYPWGLRGRAPAKLNLTLEVLSKRSDGYHEIESLLVPVNLYDTIYFRPNLTGKIDFTYSWQHSTSRKVADELPTDASNLVVQAMEAVRSLTSPQAGAAVHLVKRIPTEAGMGGGSSDAACALALANRGWNAGLTGEKLSQLAAQLGSDVPFFLVNQAAICRGRGEQVTPVATPAGLPIVVVKPPVGMSTPAIYSAVKIDQTKRSSQRLANSLTSGDHRSIRSLINNDLEKPAAAQSSWIETMRRDMAKFGCVAHQMTGSGSAYFGVCHHRRHQQTVAGRMRSQGYEQVFELQSCHH
jgi:4-diphosphocytidyl-2-C-methyl-D-erythritol kinase